MMFSESRLTPDSLEQYFSAGVPSQHVVCDAPEVHLRIDPGVELFTLRTPDDGTAPGAKGLQNVEVDVVDLEDGPWSVLKISARHMHYEAYGMAVAVAEGLRSGLSFAAATNAAMANLRSLLAARTRLSESQQVGLVGELLLLTALAEKFGPEALGWWLGPAGEQHDFAFADFDLEVKTTLSERRSHMISGVDQLRANPGRALWLISMQVTRAGGAEGITLPRLIGDLRQCFADDGRFLEALNEIGWRDADAELYDTSYLIRGAPLAYAVDEDFPALTSERLRSAIPHSDSLSDFSYRIDVTDRAAGLPGSPLHDFLDAKVAQA